MKKHVYDGIEEHDNVLPTWWLITFFGTIIFGFIYFIHYETGSGPSTQEELKVALAQIQSLKKGGPVFSEERLQALFNEDAMKQGHEIYTAKCSACHGPQGEGLIGPNLTDNFWVSGKGSRVDILGVINQGVPAKGMPAWGEQITEGELVAVAAYVTSLKGRQVPNGKPPQGTEYP